MVVVFSAVWLFYLYHSYSLVESSHGIYNEIILIGHSNAKKHKNLKCPLKILIRDQRWKGRYLISLESHSDSRHTEKYSTNMIIVSSGCMNNVSRKR